MHCTKRKYIVPCTDCGETRNVSYHVQRRIIIGQTTGKCHTCVAKSHPTTFKKGLIPHNKGANPNQLESRRLYKLKWKAKNAEKVRKYFREYYHTHPELKEVRRIYRHNRRASGAGYISKDVLNKLKAKYTCCYICSGSIEKFEIDHIVPVSKGGTNDFENLALACISCNRRKSAKPLEQFLRENSAGVVNNLY